MYIFYCVCAYILCTRVQVQCDHIKSLDAFFSSVVYTSDSYNIIALLGCGCGVATEPVAEISHRWNITQVRAGNYMYAMRARH